MYKALFIDDREMDNLLNRLMVKEEQLPLDAVYITSGEEAIEFLLDLPMEDYPSFIFIDINMPGMNGFEFSEAYNEKLANLSKAKNTTLCFLTSSISESEKERALKIPNIAAFFNKPISKHIFAEILQIHQK